MSLESLCASRRATFALAVESGDSHQLNDAYAALAEVVPDTYSYHAVYVAALSNNVAEAFESSDCPECGAAMELDDDGELTSICYACGAVNE